eukprot:1491783-Pleurochrysis_carterae.AAC.1
MLKRACESLRSQAERRAQERKGREREGGSEGGSACESEREREREGCSTHRHVERAATLVEDLVEVVTRDRAVLTRDHQRHLRQGSP